MNNRYEDVYVPQPHLWEISILPLVVRRRYWRARESADTLDKLIATLEGNVDRLRLEIRVASPTAFLQDITELRDRLWRVEDDLKELTRKRRAIRLALVDIVTRWGHRINLEERPRRRQRKGELPEAS